MIGFYGYSKPSILDKFNYGSKFNENNMRCTSISFSITSEGKIDFDFMEVFISAIERLVIKDVVFYADKNIETTKQLVSRWPLPLARENSEYIIGNS